MSDAGTTAAPAPPAGRHHRAVPRRRGGPPAPFTPVWFMRQAGRSLPEYRAVRGEGSILDAIKQPELAAEITLQPVRRYGVDAAVLYSDIVVPALSGRIRHRRGAGHRPGVRRIRCARRADLARLRPYEPTPTRPYVLETVRLVAAELRRRPCPCSRSPAHRSPSPATSSRAARRGRTSTPRRLMHTDESLWHALMERLTQHAVASIGESARRRRAGVPAVRLVGRRAQSRRLRPVRAAPLDRGVRAAAASATRRRPCIHFGIGCDHLLESMHAAMGTAGPRVIGPRLADADRRCPPPPRRRRRRPGQPRPGARPRRHRRRAAPAPTRCSPTTRAPRATSSTSATACSPNTDPGVLAGGRRPRPRAHAPAPSMTTHARSPCVLMAYGTPRTRDEILPYYTDIRRGRPPTEEQLDQLVIAATRRSLRRGRTCCRRSPSAPRRSASRCRRRSTRRSPGAYRRGARPEARGAVDRGRPSRDVVGAGVRQHRRPRARAALVGVLRRPVRGAAAGRCGAARRDGVGDRQLGDRAGVRRVPRRRSARTLATHARPTPRCCSPRTRCRSGSSTRRPVPRRAPLDRRGGRRACRARRRTGGRIAWQSAGRTPEPWLGPDILEVIDELAARRRRRRASLVCACGFVADHLEVLYDLDIEAAARAAQHGARVRPHRVRQRRPDRDGGARRPGGRSTHERRPVRRVAVSAAGSPAWPLHSPCWRTTGTARAASAARSRCSRPRTASAARSGPRRSPACAGVDEGADAFLARVPEGTQLAREVGLGDQLDVAGDGLGRDLVGRAAADPGRAGARDADRHRGRWPDRACCRWRGKIRAATEPLRPRTDDATTRSARYVRVAVRRRGPRAARRPAVGSIYATDTDRFSLDAVPQIAELAARSRSVLLGARNRPAPPTGPGLLRARRRRGRPRRQRRHARSPSSAATSAPDRPCTILEADGNGLAASTASYADAVVLACPAAQASRLLAPDRAPARRAARGDRVRRRRAGHARDPAAGLAGALAGLSGYLVPEAGAAPRHRRLVRIAEVGALAPEGSVILRDLARTRRAPGAPPRRRPAASTPLSTEVGRAPRRRPPADGGADHPLAAGVPAVPAAPPRPGRRAGGDAAGVDGRSPAPATTGSASRRASDRAEPRPTRRPFGE